MLSDLLGRGGMAEVFAGHAVGDHGFQKPVAIKRLLPELANDEMFVERLIEEAKLVVGMQHGNIVSVLDLAREGDDVFLVMEFVDGPSLRQLIRGRGPSGLSLGVATYIVQSAAAGLEFAHGRPGGAIIHADISPSNLLLTTSGEVRVADFGIARREGFGHGVVEGKWAYMAPEQARGEPLSPRSDVFALGVVLYELLTGLHPFGSTVTAAERGERLAVIPPRALKLTLPPGLDAICMRALAHDPRDRYGRMQQLIDALVEERFANGYREGASDLAQAIREVAARAAGAESTTPRTEHTDRPVTIVTRSLLPEVTPPRRSSPKMPPLATVDVRPSYAASAAVAWQRGPSDPPPRDEFPVLPTEGVRTTELAAEDPTGDQTIALEVDPSLMITVESAQYDPPVGPPVAIPSSGAYTAVLEIDRAALPFDRTDGLVHATAVEAPTLEQAPSLPALLLHPSSPAIPPFRIAPRAELPQDELASVVGGHTFTSRAPGVAVEPQLQRWAIAVLGAAALIGIVSAVASHVKPDRPAIVAQSSPAPAAPSAPPPAAPPKPVEPAPKLSGVPASPVAPSASAAPAEPSAPSGLPSLPPVQPTLPTAAEPSAATAEPTIVAAPPTPVDASPVDEDVQIERAGRRPGAASEPTRRQGVKVAARAKPEVGYLMAQSQPWSRVRVGNETKDTPAKFYLPPGEYAVKFTSPETGVSKVTFVTIKSGTMERINETLEKKSAP